MLKIPLSSCLLLLAFNLLAQPPQTFWCHELGEKQGLAFHDFNYYAFCDSDDFVWISSTEGLQRFDGQEVKVYESDIQDSTSIYGANIQGDFFEDNQKDLWFCTYEAVHVYDRNLDVFRHYFVRDSFNNEVREDYYGIHLEQGRYFWFRNKTNKEVYRVDIEQLARGQNISIESSSTISSSAYHVFVGTNKKGKVNRLFGVEDNGSIEYLKIEAGKELSRDIMFLVHAEGNKKDTCSVFQVNYLNDNEVWVASSKGMVHWDMIEGTCQFYLMDNIGNLNFELLNDTTLLVAINGKGLFEFNTKSGDYTPFIVKSVLFPENEEIKNIYRISLDRHKVLWLNETNKGLYYANLDKQKFSSISSLGKKCLGMANYDEDELLVCHSDGLYLYNKNNIQEPKLFDSLGFELSSFHGVHKGNYWLSPYMDLHVFDTKDEKLKQVNSLPLTRFLDITELSDGTLLTGSVDNPIYEIIQTPVGWRVDTIPLTDSLKISYTYIHQDSRDRIFAFRNNAAVDIYTWESGQLKLQQEFPMSGTITSFYENTIDNIIWIGTSFGLIKMNANNLNEKPLLLTLKHGLPANSIRSIEPSDNGDLWLSTSNGLSFYDARKGSFRNFTMASGIQSTQFSEGNSLQLNDGNIWWGGKYGLTCLTSDPMHFVQTKPKVLITEILIDDEIPDSVVCSKTGTYNINQVERLEYSYMENTISFSFVGSDFSDPLHTSLRYKLEGVDDHWVNTEQGDVGFARYPNLPNGDYRFIVEAVNSEGLEDTRVPRVIELSIKPPFWKKTWFICLSIGGIALFAFLFSRYRIKEFREKEQLKTRIAENKMSALIAQMSPHFIFNSLQSVNWYILKENKTKASEYLGRFSGLIRMMLENSRNTQHTLEEEINFLKLYMQVEAQRFKKPFKPDIIIDEAIDIYTIEIPTMMLQPFIENAIWHGISHREDDKGLIKIEINQKGEMLHCMVEDNGIGRERAAKLALQKGKKHKSRALQILEERLVLLFPNQKEKCSIFYTDLFDENGAACGTRVSISLPLDD